MSKAKPKSAAKASAAKEAERPVCSHVPCGRVADYRVGDKHSCAGHALDFLRGIDAAGVTVKPAEKG